jgi:hypothetical protein
MTRRNLKSLTDRELYERFIELWAEMGDSYNNSTRTYRRLFQQKDDVVRELTSRSPDAPRIFLGALNHENPWVRYGAALRCYNFAPGDAMAVFEDLAAMRYHTLVPIAKNFIDNRAQGLPFPIPKPRIGDPYRPPAREENPALRKAQEWAKQLSDEFEAERRSKR